jgi:antirestriction protein ArdC
MSKSIEKFNGLNGCVASRKDLQHIVDLAKKEEQTYISDKIENILNSFDDFEFEFENVNPAIECIPNSILDALQLDDVNEIEDFNGLQKAVTPNEIYQTITDRMIRMINEANLPSYKKKWNGKVYGKGYTIPFNFDSKKRYRGINFMLLTSFEPMENPFYLTFKQIVKYKGKLKKGSTGNIVVYFTKLYKITDIKRNIDFGSYDLQKAKDFALKNGIDANEIFYLPILKYYNVFNGKDIENIDFDLDNFKIGFIDKELPPATKMPIPEAIIKNYPAPAPKLKHGGDRAFYQPGSDFIKMPYMVDFNSAQDYYRILFHEFSHSTGSAERLQRDFSGKFGSKKYAYEELIAEWGATFLSAEAGIIWHNDKNHASYLANWNNALTHIKEDNKFIMRACTDAQKLTDFILQFDQAGNPLYFKDIAVLDEPKKIKKTQGPKKPKNKVAKVPVEIKKVVKPTSKKVSKVKVEKPVAKTRTKSTKQKVDANGQIALFGVKKQPKKVIDKKVENEFKKQTSKNSLAERLKSKGNKERDYYKIENKDIATLLGNVEIKPKESVAITVAGGQGSGKTTYAFQLINEFAKNYKVGHASFEEHVESSLYENRALKLWNEKAINEVDAPEIKTVSDLHNLIMRNDVIVIDSFSKLKELDKSLELDKDFRKKYDGKLFIIIYQLTTSNSMRGGSASQFDGDIIQFVEKNDLFAKNYVYNDKNRYQHLDLSSLKFLIASGKLQKEEKPKPVEEKTSKKEQKTVTNIIFK